MKKSIILLMLLTVVIICKAQNPVMPKNRLPEDAKLKLNKDTSPVRFAVSFGETGNGAGTNAITIHKIYNLNPSEVSIGQQSITINKTGLYHFDYYIHVTATTVYNIPVFTTFLLGVFPNSSLTFIKDTELTTTQETGTFSGNWHFSVEVHIAAPATLKLMRYVIKASGSIINEGTFLGHLISE